MKNKAQLLGLLGMSAVLGMSLPDRLPKRRYYSRIVRDGHTPWNTIKDAKVLRNRAKERRAKKARKLNWI